MTPISEGRPGVAEQPLVGGTAHARMAPISAASSTRGRRMWAIIRPPGARCIAREVPASRDLGRDRGRTCAAGEPHPGMHRAGRPPGPSSARARPVVPD